MKTTKKLLALLLSLLIILSLAACSESPSTDPNAGLYTAVTAEMMGFEMDVSELFGKGFTVELKDKGKCALVVDGKKANGKWTLSGTAFHLEGGGLDCNGTLKDGLMSLDNVMDSGLVLNLTVAGYVAPAQNISTPLVGVWEEVDIDNIYTFNADGSGSEYFEGNSWDMTWTLNGDILTMNFIESGIEEYEIFLDGDTLFVYDEDSDTEYEYYRQ